MQMKRLRFTFEKFTFQILKATIHVYSDKLTSNNNNDNQKTLSKCAPLYCWLFNYSSKVSISVFTNSNTTYHHNISECKLLLIHEMIKHSKKPMNNNKFKNWLNWKKKCYMAFEIWGENFRFIFMNIKSDFPIIF